MPDDKRVFVFITDEMLIEETYALLKKLPPIGGVLGCPRSGMIPASIIAASLSIPLYSLSDGVMIKLCSHSSGYGGRRMRMFEEKKNLPILVVDDCCYTGTEISLTKKLLTNCDVNQTFIYATVFSTPESSKFVDFFCRSLSSHDMFERDVYAGKISQQIVFDMDGMFCEEKPYRTDKSLYEEHLKTLQPIRKNLPTLFGCKAVCTGRLEKYRAITQDWLTKNGVKYKKLIMFPGSQQERDTDHNYIVGKYKAEEFLKMEDTRLFIESSEEQSKIIAETLRASDNLTPVICSTTKKVY